ncbi:MAG: methyltransferase family protein [Anaerolineae bacterium]
MILAGTFAVWASMHSLLASLPAKALARRLAGPAADRWYRFAYSSFALLSLLPLLWLGHSLADAPLYAVPAPWRWLMRAGQGLAAAGFAGVAWQISGLRFLGLTALFRPEEAGPSGLRIAGFYRCMRHPIYTFSMLFLWMNPDMTVNRLLLTALVSLYFYLGSIHEERRLTVEFGEAYRQYQRQVPRFIPRFGCRKLQQPHPQPGV